MCSFSAQRGAMNAELATCSARRCSSHLAKCVLNRDTRLTHGDVFCALNRGEVSAEMPSADVRARGVRTVAIDLVLLWIAYLRSCHALVQPAVFDHEGVMPSAAVRALHVDEHAAWDKCSLLFMPWYLLCPL